MSKKYILYNILKSLAITILTMWLLWSIPHDSGLGGLASLVFIMYGVPAAGVVFSILDFLKLRKLEDVNRKVVMSFSFLLLVAVPLPLGFFASTSISSIERHYYSSDNFIENYSDKYGFNTEILNRKATFTQCSLIEYSIEFEIITGSDSVLVFGAENITEMDRKTGFVDNLKVILDSKFEPKPGLNVAGLGLAYVVPEGQHRLKISSDRLFRLSIADSKKLFSTRSLSGKEVYAQILQDGITYQQFIEQTQDTKNTACKGTPRKYGSYWFANEHVVIGEMAITQDETHTLLYLAGYTPKLHFATIVATAESYNPVVDNSGVIKPYKTVINKYTEQEIPVFTSEKFEQRLSRSGKTFNQLIEQNAIFPEPLKFTNVEVFFEPIERTRADKVVKAIENMEPAFYNEISF